MNFRTTILLFVLVVVVGAAIYVFEAKSPPATPTIAPAFPDPVQAAESSLVEKFGDAVRITVQIADQPEWNFERDLQESTGPQVSWNMTAPRQFGVSDWQVAQIATRIKSLKYAVSFASAADGMTAEQAGLTPPRATVTIVDEKDRKVTVEIGRNEGDSETYVRLAGADTIYRVKPSLKDLLKDRPLDYREQQLFVIRPDNIVELRIQEQPESGEPQTYTLVKTGGEWRFTEPAPAKAMGDKIRTLASSFTSLRAVQWVADEVEDFAKYGLDPAPLTVIAKVEEQPETPADADTNAPPPAPEIKTYTVAFSAVSPLGEDTKVFLRSTDAPAVGTIMKTVADRFKPNLREWYDNRLVEQDPSRARRVTISSGDVVTTLERAGARWTMLETGAPADSQEVTRLLDALRDAKALNFEAGAADDPARFGFDAPRGTLEIEYPDDAKVRLTFGAYADPKTQRLVYARIDDSPAAAKLHANDVTSLLRKPADFRDRTVAHVAEDRLQRIVLSQPIEDRRIDVTIARADDVWRMVEPVDAPVDDAQMRKLVALLGNWHASRLVDRPADRSLDEFGLDGPTLDLNYTYAPDPIVHVDSDGAKQVPAEPVTLTVRVARHDDAVYALRAENDSVVFQVDAAAWDTLSAEFRKPDVFDIDVEQLSKVTLRDGDDTQGFEKQSGKWVYLPEADIPLNEEAVKNYLLRLRDLKVVRVVEYNPADLARYGLDAPAQELTLTANGQDLPALLISGKTNADGALYARSADAPHVFVIPKDVLDRIRINLAEFETGT